MSDTTRDASLTRALNSACTLIDDLCGRSFSLGSALSDLVVPVAGSTFSDEDGEHLLIPDVGTLTGLVVATGAGSTFTALPAGAYEAMPLTAISRGRPVTEIVMIGSCWPRFAGSRVRVTAKFGWPSVPNNIMSACLLMSMRLWKRKDSPEGVIGSAEWGAIRVSRFDSDVENLLAPYRKAGFA